MRSVRILSILPALLLGAGLAARAADVAPPANTGAAAVTAPAASEDSVRKLLQQQGYTDIESVTRSGSGYTVRASKDGRPITVELSASALGDDYPRGR